MKHIVSSGNLAVVNSDGSSKYLYCPFSNPQKNCGTWCPLFEVASRGTADGSSAAGIKYMPNTHEVAVLHCAPNVREVELTEQFTKKG